MNLGLETIAARISVRSYDGQPIESATLEKLCGAFADVGPGPFGGTARFVLVSSAFSGLGTQDQAGLTVGGKIGTYGLISKVPAFIVGAISRGPRAMEDFGYLMEGLVLKATEFGLGSCWIGGLFDRGASASALRLAPGELLPAVIAIGHPAERRTIADAITRGLARAENRKSSGDLFWKGEPGYPLDTESSPWREAFKAVRIAPSASNKQPWRILQSGPESAPRFDFILDEDRLYNSALGDIHLQNVDMGIAMRHFEAAILTQGLPGRWERYDGAAAVLAKPLSYIASWQA